MPRIRQPGSNQKQMKRKLREQYASGGEDIEDPDELVQEDGETLPGTGHPESLPDNNFNRSQPGRFMPERGSDVLFASEIKSRKSRQ